MKIIIISILFLSIFSVNADEATVVQFTWQIKNNSVKAIPDGIKMTYYKDNAAAGFIVCKKKNGYNLYGTAGIVNSRNDDFLMESGIAIGKKVKVYGSLGLIQRDKIVSINLLGENFELGLGFYSKIILNKNNPVVDDDTEDEERNRHHDDDDD